MLLTTTSAVDLWFMWLPCRCVGMIFTTFYCQRAGARVHETKMVFIRWRLNGWQEGDGTWPQNNNSKSTHTVEKSCLHVVFLPWIVTLSTTSLPPPPPLLIFPADDCTTLVLFLHWYMKNTWKNEKNTRIRLQGNFNATRVLVVLSILGSTKLSLLPLRTRRVLTSLVWIKHEKVRDAQTCVASMIHQILFWLHRKLSTRLCVFSGVCVSFPRDSFMRVIW